ncbi:MAG: iron-containing alcohol dehydrogenase, partial [Stellaceae bacterium]
MAAIVTTPRLMAIGGGALGELPGVLQRFGLARPVVVTDPYIKSCGILDRTIDLLAQAGIGFSVFADTVADPTTAVIEEGTRRLAEGGYDSLVAVGGGSSIDTAKGMSVLAANGGRMRDWK